MNKILKILMLIFAFMPLFKVTGCAEDINNEAAEEIGIYNMEKALPEEIRDIGGELDVYGQYDSSSALKNLIEFILDEIKKQFRPLLETAFRLISIIILCGVSGTLAGEKNIQNFINTAACCTCSLMVAGGTESLVSTASKALTQLSDYSKAAMPAIFTAAAATGAVVTSSARYAAVCISIDLMINISQNLVIPLIYSYLAIIMTDSVINNSVIKACGRIVKWSATTVMTAMTMIFSAYIGMTGIISASTDAVAVKTAKTVISSVLPVIGGIISDASATVLSAAAVIKNTAGVFSLIAVCALCAGPFAGLALRILFYKAAAAAADIMPDKSLSGLLNNVSGAMSLLLGLVGSCGVMMFISFMSGIKVVAP